MSPATRYWIRALGICLLVAGAVTALSVGVQVWIRHEPWTQTNGLFGIFPTALVAGHFITQRRRQKYGDEQPLIGQRRKP